MQKLFKESLEGGHMEIDINNIPDMNIEEMGAVEEYDPSKLSSGQIKSLDIETKMMNAVDEKKTAEIIANMDSETRERYLKQVRDVNGPYVKKPVDNIVQFPGQKDGKTDEGREAKAM